ncbi:MAG: hypothetical protein ACREMY_31575 [bacterium]
MQRVAESMRSGRRQPSAAGCHFLMATSPAGRRPFRDVIFPVSPAQHSLFKPDQAPCFSLLSDLSKSAEVAYFWGLLSFFIFRSLFFSKITLFSAK